METSYPLALFPFHRIRRQRRPEPYPGPRGHRGKIHPLPADLLQAELFPGFARVQSRATDRKRKTLRVIRFTLLGDYVARCSSFCALVARL